MSVLDRIRRAIGRTQDGGDDAGRHAPTRGDGRNAGSHSKVQAEETPSKGKRRGCC